MHWLILVLLVLVSWNAPAVTQKVTDKELTFAVGGVTRRAILVNENPNANLRPAVIVLHGGRGSAEEQRRRSDFDALAVAEKFTVVFAEGTSWGLGFHAWNTGHLQRKQVGGADDIGYFDTLINLLIKEHRIDPGRIYLTGGSNGAMMTFVYAVNRPEKLAAIAPIVGAMFTFEKKPSRPVPILMINGQQDDEVPIEGGMSRNPAVRNAQRSPFRPLADTVAFWVLVNRSQQTGISKTEGTVTTTTYPATNEGAVTISIIDAAGGHGWPGTESRRSDNTPIKAFKGAEKVWSFFKTQRRGS